ncbi:hypothetical protein CQA38_01240 [Campylobacter sp. MIT 12-5580]|uniref:DUF2972 domain-containing protein n=1 Tax=Campylobacter sp. MIT 12-5580 TaxID=2040651 RepID=UPI0010F589BB|nr:DUF2972 domain-containing protein [Campylobacter sp. MIT 12-5580]TKX30294.1 hypothetical protein CQA38_01240 [Campylobacter sp. MIT 12-5580]
MHKNFLHLKDTIQELHINKGHILSLLKEDESFYFTQAQKLNPKLFHQASFSFKDLNFKSLDFILTHIDTIQTWLASDKFKEKYLDTKHSYPALLDCDVLQANLEKEQKSVENEKVNKNKAFNINQENINKNKFDKTSENNANEDEFDANETLSYNDIPAEVAWELNLALPDKFDFMAIVKAVSGHAMMYYVIFPECKIRYVNGFGNGQNSESFYKQSYEKLLHTQENYNLLDFICYGYEQCIEKICAILAYYQDKKIIFNTRDPFGRMGSAINHIDWIYMGEHTSGKIFANINLSTPFKKSIDTVRYFCNGASEPTLDRFCNQHIMALSDFYFHTITKYFKQDKIYYLDIEDLAQDRCYDTFCKLASIFNFSKPRLEAKEKFACKHNSPCYGMLPCIILAHNDDMDNVYFEGKTSPENLESLKKKEDGVQFAVALRLIKFQSKFNKEVSENLYPDYEKWHENNNLFKECGIFINHEDWQRLKENKKLFQAVKKYLQGFMPALKNEIKRQKAIQISKEQILQYYNDRENLKKELYFHLKKELIDIKQTRPDIIASWKYYNEFEKMCEELDGKD